MVTKTQTIQFLAEVPIFAGLARKDLERLRSIAKQVDHAEGHVITREGGGAVAFHVVLAGEVDVIQQGRAIARLGSGESFGEMSILDGEPRSASVVAATPVTTLAIPAADFRDLVDQNPLIARKIIATLSRRLREADKSLLL